MSVVTRFAPSPTGYLHIGGARTALFNWLYARHHGGKFHLRIEDTDRARSTEEALNAIYDGLRWMGLDWDGDAVSQYNNREKHAAAAKRLLDGGKAYYCYASPEELQEMREQAKKEGRPMRYDGRWRDKDPSEAPTDVKPVVRFKAPQEGETVINDLVQGEVKVSNDQLDDMVLLRADGSPTYMLAVVVDDHDMGITHVIRGDDHLTNAFRQYQLFKALGWEVPAYAHIPLIHGPDGAKLSKRHGALGVETYRDMGFLPEAMRNYLLRLGWAHGDEEIISDTQAIEWFDLDAVGRSPARFDTDKLTHLNAHYLRQRDDEDLAQLITPRLEERVGRLSQEQTERLIKGMPGLKERAETLVDLAERAMIYVAARPLAFDDKAAALLDDEARAVLADLRQALEGVSKWTPDSVENTVRAFAEDKDLKLGKVAQPLRAALTGTTVSPGIFEVVFVLGKEETLARLDDAT